METKVLYFDWAGVSWRVKVDAEEGQVEHIYSVEAVAKNGEYVLLEVEPNEFLETMQDALYEAVEQAKMDARADYEDRLYEQAREEGRL